MTTPVLDATRDALIRHAGLTSLQPDASFDRAVRLLATGTQAPVAAFTVLAGNRQFVRAGRGVAEAGREMPRGDSFCQHTVAAEAATVIPDTRADPRTAASPLTPEWGFYAGVPVRAPSGVALGALCVWDAAPRGPTPLELAMLDDLRDTLEETLRLRFMAVMDVLTGLYNRRGFEAMTGAAWDTEWQAARPLAVVAVDADRFKAYNDTLGHAAGDVLLAALGGTLATVAAEISGAVAARLGGEEFCLLLPATDRARAESVCADLQARIGALGFTSPATNGPVSVSMGCALLGPDAAWPALADALEAADGALYQAKANGRARVEFHAF